MRAYSEFFNLFHTLNFVSIKIAYGLKILASTLILLKFSAIFMQELTSQTVLLLRGYSIYDHNLWFSPICDVIKKSAPCLWPLWLGQCPKHNLWRAFDDGLVDNGKNSFFLKKNITNWRVISAKTMPYLTPKWPKSIAYLWPKRLKKPYSSGPHILIRIVTTMVIFSSHSVIIRWV